MNNFIWKAGLENSSEQKDQLIKALTDGTAQILDLDPSKIIVVLNEHSPESWAVGGKKVSEIKK